MRTVKEVSELTGISVRMLHYYDEIGLLKPTEFSQAGYRLYDDKALEILQQILFFREFDMPLKEIKSIMENPHLDKTHLLTSQKNILVIKKERLERIITSIESILKGDNKMDFQVFSQTEIDEMYQALANNMSDEQRKIIATQYGSMKAYEKHFTTNASRADAQKNFAKVVEWYGDKESAKSASENPHNRKIIESYSSRYEAVLKKLAAQKESNVHSFEVKAIVGELDFVSKQLYQMKDVSALMREMAKEYQNNRQMQETMDAVYGEDATIFIGEALEAFYK